MLLTDAMIASMDSVFHITNDDIEPVERCNSLRITTFAGCSDEVNMSFTGKRVETAKAIANDNTLRSKIVARPMSCRHPRRTILLGSNANERDVLLHFCSEQR